MALFKISKGISTAIPSSKTEGSCYFTTDNGKFYIDVDSSTRQAINAEKADQWTTARTLKIGNGEHSVDGSQNVTWTATEMGVPTISGTGATGTWGIGISGNAATATKVKKSLTINGKTFNGSAAIDVGTIGIAYGGTGATDAATARTNLGITLANLGAAAAAHTHTTDQIMDLADWAKQAAKPSYKFSEITSRPTTISGYGITDAKIASGIITLGSNTITPLTANSTLNSAKLSGTIPSTCLQDAVIPGSPTTDTAPSGTNTNRIATTAFVQDAVSKGFAANDAMVYKGTVSAATGITGLTNYSAGWTYRATAAFTINNVGTVEIGDLIVCITDSATYNAAHWTIVQTNLDGAVIGPTSSVTNRIATFNGTSGHLIKDSGKTLSDFLPIIGGTLTGTLTAQHIIPNLDATYDLGSNSNAWRYLYLTGGIYHKSTNTTNQIIKFLDNTVNSYGTGIVIGGGGVTVVGAGESAQSMSVAVSSESLYLLADGSVFVEGKADTLAKRTGFAVDTSGNIIPVKAELGQNNVQNIGSSSYKWANVYATTFIGNLSGTATTATNLASGGTWTWTDGTTAGPTASLTIGGKLTSISAIPTATDSISGIVTTGAQTFSGIKTFKNGLNSDGSITIGSTNSSNTVTSSGNLIIGARSDSFGLLPYGDNWNRIGLSDRRWYQLYVNQAFINSFPNGTYFGTASTASAAGTGALQIYNRGAANVGTLGSYTKIQSSEGTVNYTQTLQAATGTIALTDGSGAYGTWTININGSATSATTATALSSSAGTSTKPIYFSSGKPVACSQELKATVNNATQWGVAYYSTTTNITSTAAGTSGYLLQSNGSAAPSWIQATNGNTGGTIVKRDASGNFSAATITATLSGNASSATKLETSRTIQTNLASTSSASFNGSANIAPGVTGTLGIANGGTGKTTAADAWTALGGGASGKHADSYFALNGHTHSYAGSSSVGGAANSVQSNLIIDNKTFNGSSEVTVGNTVHYIIGTAGTNYGDWIANDASISSFYDGLTINYVIPKGGNNSGTARTLTNSDGSTVSATYTWLQLNGTWKKCYYGNLGHLTTYYNTVGQIIQLVYRTSLNSNNGGWIALGDYDTNDISTIQSYYDRITAGTNGLKQYSLAMKDADGKWQSFTTTNGQGTTKTKNPVGFVPGDIVYLNMSGNIAANAITGYGVVRHYSALIDYRYSSNVGTTLTSNKIVYLKGTIGIDGLFYLADSWMTQTLPTSEDDCVYIPIGIVYPDSSTYRCDFSGWHTPVYYANGGIHPYLGEGFPKRITKSLTPTIAWSNTGIAGENLENGSYIIQVYVNATATTNLEHYIEYYTGMMSWFNAMTNSTDADEIILHKAGHASNSHNIYLRTIRQSFGDSFTGRLQLQIAADKDCTTAADYIFKFKKII